MATTSIWKVEARLDKVIKYTTNIEKTQNGNYDEVLYKSLHNVVEYTKAEFKTEKQFFVSGVNCEPENALEEMVLTKKHFGKEKGILAYHAFQSFAEGEVTPELAHEIRSETCKRIMG